MFLSFQWDLLLLETGVLALLATLWPEWVAWLFRWLLFRLMFLSGAVKLLSGDESWHSLTALTFHFQTQPLPNVVVVVRAPAPTAGARSGRPSACSSLSCSFRCCFLRRAAARLAGAAATVAFQMLILPDRQLHVLQPADDGPRALAAG